MNRQLVFLCAFSVFSTVICVIVDKCSDDIPTAVHFVSEGCGEFPCPLVRGTYSNVNITFRIPADTSTSTIKIEAKTFLPGWVPFPVPDNNTCHNLLNSYCPLDENELVTYHLAIKIVKAYPKMKMTLRIQYTDDKNGTMACMLVPCAVVDPPAI